MEHNQQNSENQNIIFLPDTIHGYVPSSSVTPPVNNMTQQSEVDPSMYKKWWDDDTTKLLISEFKTYYQLWRSGKINKKITMWKRIAEKLNNKGLMCTADQVQNKYKTLLRSYRKSCGIAPSQGHKNHNRPRFKYESELSDIFMEHNGLNDEHHFSEEVPPECAIDQESSEDEARNDFNLFDDTSLDEPPTPTNLFNSRKETPAKVNYGLPKRKLEKTNVEVLEEIKELMKKVELRRQIRHEQNLKVAMERNKLLKRKNDLMEQMLRNN